jgi:hypothetical protein
MLPSLNKKSFQGRLFCFLFYGKYIGKTRYGKDFINDSFALTTFIEPCAAIILCALKSTRSPADEM